jgi:ABC-type multidrug transport system ATPase subunit
VSSSFPFSKATLAFHDLRYTVFVDPSIKDNADTLAGGSDKGMLTDKGELIDASTEKQGAKVGLALLRNIHGVASPGRMIALMGASGAGKTTLMDCLCGRKSQGVVDGTVSINGSTLSPTDLAQTIAYVEQSDLHFPEATVREALLFSAKLRLPAKVTSEQRAAFVDENLTLLEMENLRDRPVRTLAPAELKLTTIGVELSANPAILALDEPTTGLDARSAAIVMRVMRNIANTGRTIVATIHQPSSSIFLSFDDLLLLERGGRQVYFGELGRLASTFVAFLEAVPGVHKLPARTNPATWMLEEVARFQDSQIDAAEASGDAEAGKAAPASAAGGAGSAAGSGIKRSKSLARVYSTSALRAANAARSVKVALGAEFEVANPIGSRKSDSVTPAGAAASGVTAAASDEAKPGFLSRIGTVSWRVLEDYWRNTEYNGSRLITLIFLAVVFGLAFLGIDTSEDEAGVRSAISVLYTAAGFGGTISFSSLLPALGKRRAAYYREKSVGMYPPAAYYIAITVIEAVYLGVMLCFFVPILYFLVGLRADVSTFFETFIIVWLVAIWFISFAQFFVALMPSIVVAQIVSGAVLLTQTNLFSGVFLPPADIPEVYRWIYAINPTGLATRGLALVQFNTPAGEDPTIIEAFVNGRFQAVDRQTWVETFVDAKYEDRWDVMWQIALIALVVELLAIIFLTFINHSKR